MKVSLQIVKQFINFDLPPVDELVARINAQLGGVEEVIDLGAKYKDVKIVKVVECEKHPNADKLSSCKIDAGTGELIQVVCGAPNVHAGMWAAWLPPESIVPSTYGTNDEFKLGARELRGIISNGMLASARELGIGDDHDGIVDIKESDLPEGKVLHEGVSFADVFGLDDFVVDIENKMFTHRPDLFGQLGVAREIAGIFGERFKSPDWYSEQVSFDNPEETLPLEVFNDAFEAAPRFMAVVMKDVIVGPSPLWLKCALVAMGGKPINNIVDATNYIMLLTAQPTHAYDYDKIRGNRLGVRMAKGGEKLPLLNGKTYELTSDDIVIADAEGAIGLAGIMGGGNSEVTSETKRVVLEVANFDMYTVRKSSMRHGIFTDALARFNKGQSPLQNAAVLSQLMKIIPALQASVVFDDLREYDDSREFQVTPKFINQRLGLSLQPGEISDLLRNVEISADSLDDHDAYFSIFSPFWRTDLEQPEDIVEEVGRLHGYDKLPRELPLRSTAPTKRNDTRALSQKLRTILSRAGANEVLTYSFVHEKIIKAATQDMGDAYRLSNALSPDLQYYRLSLTPSLLDKIHGNSKAGHDEFALFEIGKAHSKSLGMDEQVPREARALSFVYAAKLEQSGAAFYKAKKFLSFLADNLGLGLRYEQLEDGSTSHADAPFEPKRSAVIVDVRSGKRLGVIGEFKLSVRRDFKLPDYSAGFEIDTETLLQLTAEATVGYKPLSRYPSTDRDISLKTSVTLPYADIVSALREALSSLESEASVVPLSIYQPENGDTKNTSFRLTFSSREKTLTSGEVNELIGMVGDRLQSSIGAEII